MFFRQLTRSLSDLPRWLYITWLTFLVDYRKTVIGPIWLTLSPALFIGILGVLFAEIADVPIRIFLPFMGIGFVTWTLISGLVVGSTTVLQRSRSQILHAGMAVTDLMMVDVLTTLVRFLHQAVLIPVIFLIVGHGISIYASVSLIGLLLIVANGIWLTVVFGIIGARYRDFTEVVQAIMRIAFLATPIIWMPSAVGRGSALNAFLTYNPFYHFVELVRAPLMDQAIAPLSWIVVMTITIGGFILAATMYGRYSRQVALWV